MTLIDRIMLARADDQVASQAVYRRDRDEPKKVDGVCVWCSVPVFGRAEMCQACRDAGRTATLCRWGCGRYVTRTDQTGPQNPALRNICRPCRTEHHRLGEL